MDDLLFNDNEYSEQMVDIMYPKELQLSKTYDIKAPFQDLKLSISN